MPVCFFDVHCSLPSCSQDNPNVQLYAAPWIHLILYEKSSSHLRTYAAEINIVHSLAGRTSMRICDTLRRTPSLPQRESGYMLFCC